MSNWFEKLLTPVGERDEIENIPIKPILEFDTSNEGPVTNGAGVTIAKTETGWDETSSDFDLRYRLRIHPDSWERIEVICDGNAMDVATALLPNGRYKVTRTLRGLKPTTVIEDSEVGLYDHASTKDFIKWVEKQDYDTIEAYRQIYYDRWCFDSGNRKDRMYYEILEEEKKGTV